MGRISIETPVGPIWVEEAEDAITGAGWGHVDAPDDTPLLRATAAELRAYFDGNLSRFTVPIRHGRAGSAAKVLDAMLAIPMGETRRYGEIAKDVGLPAQAVGQACGGNVIPILIPCHRVLSASGLGGYSGRGGVDTKVWLLRHEGAAGLLI
ncbi:methylated-DNA--[protein]-cysteine S-methyltransferase [Gymnodinialimonas ceratoperidinii]|uniref:Methylated-DNA--[protein]-cysteine S-methyltransferase n=1 Tax=Gymnodinialimonas ceratoperidinii TaxID=2856823 RepID=A0A8F6YB72_9RHOB|nr:methylated-DNA--[protein]-cysteine S-methyltransferase [Gymnodinialimonas ceratoperidinii]QXT40674.1 methylated-DNA--[protein]-cysteine S-methyltransferase [Gymnodinialimonas ceratoperidinii]